MSRKVIGGLIQCSNPINDPSASVPTIRDAMFEKHLPFIHDAGKKGVPLNKSTDEWPKDSETILCDALLNRLLEFGGGIVGTRHHDATRNPDLKRYKRPPASSGKKEFVNLSLLHQSFPRMDFSTLYPPPPWE